MMIVNEHDNTKENLNGTVFFPETRLCQTIQQIVWK